MFNTRFRSPSNHFVVVSVFLLVCNGGRLIPSAGERCCRSLMFEFSVFDRDLLIRFTWFDWSTNTAGFSSAEFLSSRLCKCQHTLRFSANFMWISDSRAVWAIIVCFAIRCSGAAMWRKMSKTGNTYKFSLDRWGHPADETPKAPSVIKLHGLFCI